MMFVKQSSTSERLEAGDIGKWLRAKPQPSGHAFTVCGVPYVASKDPEAACPDTYDVKDAKGNVIHFFHTLDELSVIIDVIEGMHMAQGMAPDAR